MAEIRKLIKSIKVDKANFEHIAKTGNINGTLLIEIERVMEKYASEKYNKQVFKDLVWKPTIDRTTTPPTGKKDNQQEIIEGFALWFNKEQKTKVDVIGYTDILAYLKHLSKPDKGKCKHLITTWNKDLGMYICDDCNMPIRY